MIEPTLSALGPRLIHPLNELLVCAWEYPNLGCGVKNPFDNDEGAGDGLPSGGQYGVSPLADADKSGFNEMRTESCVRFRRRKS